jgi:uncharacterized C2H2 Zn-finger protein
MGKSRNGRRSRIYFRDGRIPIIAGVAVVGCLCIFGYFSHILQSVLLGPNPSHEQSQWFNLAAVWIMAVVLALTFASLLVLLVYSIQVTAIWIRRKPLSCPRCNMVDSSGVMRIAQQPVEGTDWKLLTCPRCAHEWHMRR